MRVLSDSYIEQPMIYNSVNLSVLKQVPESARHILDVGCGSGELGLRLKGSITCDVTGLTSSEQEAEIAQSRLNKVIVCDLNTFQFEQLAQFDCIICSHVLEHLFYPEVQLSKLKNNLAPDGSIIIALPNVLYWRQRLEFLKGNFRYTSGGLMDSTHFRFFDWNTAYEMVEASGFRVISRRVDACFPQPVIRKWIKPLDTKLDNLAGRIFPQLFGTQFIITAQFVKED